MKRSTKMGIAILSIIGSGTAIAQVGITTAAPAATFVTQKELIASTTGGSGVAGGTLSKGNLVTRVGNDRISVDVLKRTTLEEGPIVHASVTEIYQVLEGGGDLETGGIAHGTKPMLAKDGKPFNPESIGPSVSGTSETGGSIRHIGAGDIIMIPPGVPHHFTKLDGFITYAVTRVNPGYFAGK